MSDALNLTYMPDGRVINVTNNDPAIERVTGFSTYWVAADPGQANDYSAVVVIKDEALLIVDNGKVMVGPRQRTVVYADRFRGVSSVDLVDHLIEVRNASPFGGKSELVIDGTSIGCVVSDMLWDKSVGHNAVQMTGAGNQDITQSRSAAGHGDLGIALIVGAFASQYLKPQKILVSTLRG